jgi:C4-dicarboxylate-specific signal transduction histidine kinase
MLSHSGFYEDMALLRKDGYLAFATLSVKTLSGDQTGGQNLAFCILHDMGAKKSMERDLLAKHWELKSAYEELERAHMELKSAQEALVQAGKLAALGELAAGVAHELNQPLSGVLGFGQELERILREKFPDPTALDFAGEVTKNAIRMKKIIQQLREFTRRSVEDFQKVEIAGVVTESLKLLEQQFKSRGIEVEINTAKGLPKVYCNPFQLEQVFINLATNARDAIEATGRGDGHIEIELRPKAADPKRFLEVQFRDDGAGMNIETKNRAFEPFFTTKEVGKGTGLGLSVSYGILSKIHGSMMVESAPGKGTTFVLTLPVDYRTLNSHEPATKEG